MSNESIDLIIYGLGAIDHSGEYVHLEDIALKCYELWPDRFSWENHKYPDKDRVRRVLRRKSGDLVELKMNAWRLTTSGIKLFMDNKSTIESNYKLTPSSLRIITESERDKFSRRIRAHQLFESYENNGGFEKSFGFLFADLVDCMPEASRKMKLKKIEELEATAALIGEQDIIDFLASCKNHLKGS